jgi:hypothetical protein
MLLYFPSAPIDTYLVASQYSNRCISLAPSPFNLRSSDEKSKFAGTYKITIKNNSGETSDSFSVTVTGLPGPPQGPLEATDISRHSCTLAWRPPTYDGGLPVTHYVVERVDVSGTIWITIASSVRDTKYTVLGLVEGQEYNFRIHAANENGIGPALEGINPIKVNTVYVIQYRVINT